MGSSIVRERWTRTAPVAGVRRRTHRLLAALLATMVLLLVLPAPAQAHASLVRTDPADGTTLEHAPQTLTLSFSEHVVLDATRIEIVDGDGRSVPVSDLRIATTDPAHTEAPAAVVAKLPDLRANTYRVSWRTLSSDDLHESSGSLTFGVRRSARAGEFVEAAPRVEESVLRWLLLLGVALALGSAALERHTGGRHQLSGGGRRLAGLAWLGILAALMTSVLLLLDQITPTGLSLPRLLGSSYGARWAWRETGLALLAASALLGVRGVAPGVRRLLLLLGALVTATGTAALGHAGSASGVTRLLATSAHILAVTTWVGGVLCLLVLVSHPHRGEPGVVALRALMRAFAVPAALCVSVAVVTGVYLSSTVVGSVDALIATTYGRTLLVKLGLVALMGVAGLVNHRRLRGRHDLDVPRRTVAAEAALGVLVLAASGVLASGQPATEAQFVRAPVATHGPLTTRVVDLEEAVSLRPNVPGRNVASVDVFDTRRPSPGPISGVDLAVGGRDVPMTPLGDGHWSGAVDDLHAGSVSLTVTVHRDGLPDSTWHRGWVVDRSGPARTVVMSDAPVAGLLRGAAIGLALLLAGAWGWGLLARLRRAASAPAPRRRLARPPARPAGRSPR